MKKKFLWFPVGLAVLFSFLYLPACSSNDGGGAPPPAGASLDVSTFSRGIIADKGSILVNGVNFDTSNADILVNGSTGSENDLKIGQFVTVRGNTSGRTGTASSVNFSNRMTGPVSGVTGSISDTVSNATLTVFGQTIMVDRDTVFEPSSASFASLNTGSVVEVSGLPDDKGVIHATMIESRPTATEFNIRGMVSSVTGSMFELVPTVNAAPVTMTLSPTAAELPADFGMGTFVNATIDPQTFAPESTEVVAESVSMEMIPMPAENDIVFVEGFVSQGTGTDAVANTFILDGLTVDPGLFAVPSPGTRVVVHGAFSEGMLHADLIRFAGLSAFTVGAVTSVGTQTADTDVLSMVTVNGIQFDVSDAIIRMNAMPGGIQDLMNGKQVIVESAVLSSLSTATTGTDGLASQNTGTSAMQILVIENMTGPLSSASGTIASGPTGTTEATFRLFGQTVFVNNDTKFSPALDSMGTGTLASFGTGSVIGVSAMPDGMGNLVATFIESRPTATQYRIMGLVSGVTGSPVTSFMLTPSCCAKEVTVNLASGVTPPVGFAEGEFVDITIDPASTTPGATTVTATAVDVVMFPLLFENDRVNVEGLVSDLTGTTFIVNSIDVAAGEQSLEGIQNGTMVRVHGAVDTRGNVRAERIRILE